MAAPQRERDHGRDIITLGLNSERKKEAKESARVRMHLTHTHAFVHWVARRFSLLSARQFSVCLQGLNTRSWRRYVQVFVLRIASFASDLLHQNRWCREPPEVSCPHHKYKLVTEEVSQLQICPTRAGVSPVRFDKKINDEKILERGPFIASWLEKWQLL